MTDVPPVTIRPLDVGSDADLSIAYDVVRASELAVVGWSDATLEAVTSDLTGPQAWRAALALACIGDEPQGLLAAELMPESREVFLDVFALGERSGEIQGLLLAEGLSAARVVAADFPGAAEVDRLDPFELSADFWQVTAAAFSQDSGYAEALGTFGFRPIRRFWRMLCDLDGQSAVEPAAPPGVTRRVVDGEADERLMHRLFADSFAEHFGHTVEEPFESWIVRVRANAGNREDGWWIAEAEGVPAGLCIVDDSKAEFAEGYVRTLGVLSEARGRGIGRWLLQCAAADAVRRGRTAIALTVDGANTTGATELYESVGYRTRQEVDVYCYPLVEGA